MRWYICIFICCVAVHVTAQESPQLIEFNKAYALYQNYNNARDYDKALPYAKKTYTLSIKIFGEFHKNTLRLLNNIALLYKNQGKYKKAELLFLKCFPLMKQKLGESHLDTLSSLNNLASLYRDQGRYEKAESLLFKCLQLMKQKLGESHPLTLKSMNSLAVLYSNQGIYEKAEPLFLKTLQLRKQKLGENHPDTIYSLNNLAALYGNQGRYEKAEHLLFKCLQLRKQKLGENHPDTLKSLNNLAALYGNQGRYEKAEPLYLKAYQLRKQKLGENHPDTLTSLNNLATLYGNKGRYEKVEPLYLKALQLRKQKLGENHSDTLQSMNNLAVLYHSQGKYEKAESLFLKTLQLRKQKLGENHPDTLQSLNNLTGLYYSQGKYEKVEPLLIRCLQLMKQKLGESHPLTLKSLNSLALLCKSQGRYEKAEPLYLKALQLRKQKFGENHPDTLQSLNNLAGLYYSQGKYEKVEPLLIRCLQLMKQKLGESHPSTINSLNSLAVLYYSQEKYEKAESLYLKCLQLMKQKLGESHPKTLRLMNNFAFLYYSQGRYEKAETLYLKCMKLRKQKLGKNHPDILTSLWSLAFLYGIQRQYNKAQKILDEWFNKRNEYLHDLLQTTGKKTQKSYLQEDINSIKALLSLYLRKSDREIGKKILDYSLQRKGILLHFSPDTISRTSRSNKQVAKVLSELQGMRSTLASWFINPPKNITAQKLKENIQILRAEVEDKEGELARLSKNFRRAIRRTTVESLQKELKPKEAVVDFLVIQTYNLNSKKSEDLPEQLIATITTKSDVILVRLGKYASIQKLIREYRKQVTDPSSWKLNEIARKINQKVWQPLEQFCTQQKIIYVIPDDDLHLFPFQAMVDQDGRYLLEKCNIHMISSARYLTYTVDDYDPVSDKPTVFANPHYGNSNAPQQNRGAHFKNMSFSPLPGTEKEGKALAKMLRAKQEQVATFFANNASKQNITKIVAPKVLHIATHGFFLKTPIKESKDSRGFTGFTSFENTLSEPLSFSAQQKQLPQAENPLLYSGLAFSGANVNQANGILTAMEVLSLDLSGTELVTLSACDTSVGEVIPGDGVYSLRRAFQEAGTKAVLSSLWPASDEGTLHLMKKFYGHYLNKVTPQSAIRAAQLECIAEGKYAHPYYWANFVMVGSDHLFPQHHVLEPISIRQNSSSNLYMWALVILVVIIVIATIVWFVILQKQTALQQQTLRNERRQRRLQR